uniref:Uncharacterized protein n=1 Tax=Romanomermis culicivorax TaxID=13658 RepID=A0A915JYM5_ROMCU
MKFQFRELKQRQILKNLPHAPSSPACGIFLMRHPLTNKKDTGPLPTKLYKNKRNHDEFTYNSSVKQDFSAVSYKATRKSLVSTNIHEAHFNDGAEPPHAREALNTVISVYIKPGSYFCSASMSEHSSEPARQACSELNV